MLPPEREQLLAMILRRSATDSDFRRQLLDDPRRAIERAFHVVIPATFTIRFIEKDPGVDALVVLPDPALENGELSASALEAVSGGAESARWDS